MTVLRGTNSIGLLGAFLAIYSAMMGDVTKLVPSSQPIPASLFGMHIHHLVSPKGKEPLTPWPAVNIPQWRLWDAHLTWPDIEPTKGVWRFENVDKSLQAAQAHGTDVLFTLGLTPTWASARPQEPSGYKPGYAAEPIDIQDWRDFVSAVATRYKGRVHEYEIGNEPNLHQFWTGSLDQMLALVREASPIIHGIDPTAIIVSPSATKGTDGVRWLAEFLQKGGGQYVDVIGFHFYVPKQPPESMLPLIKQIQQTMADNGAAGKPLWDTEAGWLDPNPYPNNELLAAYLARAYILHWAVGVQRFYWYSWDSHNMTVDSTEPGAEVLQPAGRAYGIIQNWLVGATMDWCSQDNSHTWTCELNRQGALQWIIWNPDGPKTISIPSSWRAKSVTVLLQEAQPFSGSSLDVGQMPILLTN
jgi:Glycosyl hydrolases family 39